MKYLLLLLLALSASAQTRVRWDQLNKYSESLTREGDWCSAPNILVNNDKQFVVGPKWTASDPCYIHFGIVPPGSVDPLSISKFTSPLVVDINPAFVGDDEVYVWATEPKFSPVTPSKLYIGVKDASSITCPACLVVAQPTTPRVFPAGVVPIGFFQIVQGKLHPKANDILDGHQIHIATMPMSVKKFENGYLFELTPATVVAANAQKNLEATQAQLASAKVQKEIQAVQNQKNLEFAQANAERSKVALSQAKMDNEARLARSEPAPIAMLREMDRRVNETQILFMQMQGQMPVSKADVNERRKELNELEQRISELHMRIGQQMEMAQDQAQSRMMAGNPDMHRVSPPSTKDSACSPPQWSVDDRFYYVCIVSDVSPSPRWIRYQIDPWETRLAQNKRVFGPELPPSK